MTGLVVQGDGVSVTKRESEITMQETAVFLGR